MTNRKELTYTAAAARLGVCVRTIQRMIERGELRPVYRRMRAFVPQAQVERIRRER